MPTCTICGEGFCDADDAASNLCTSCYALNLAGTPLDDTPSSEPANTSLLPEAVRQEHAESAAIAAWVEHCVALATQRVGQSMAAEDTP